MPNLLQPTACFWNKAKHVDLQPKLALQGGDDDDYDPLDAFMAGVQREVVANKPTNRARPGLELDESDHVADYMEQQQAGEATISNAFPILISQSQHRLWLSPTSSISRVLANMWAATLPSTHSCAGFHA